MPACVRWLVVVNVAVFLVQMFLFALVAVIAYPVLDWTPAFIRRPAKYIYLALMLAAFIFTTVYSWSL